MANFSGVTAERQLTSQLTDGPSPVADPAPVTTVVRSVINRRKVFHARARVLPALLMPVPDSEPMPLPALPLPVPLPVPLPLSFIASGTASSSMWQMVRPTDGGAWPTNA